MEQIPSNAPVQPASGSGNERTFALVSTILGVVNLCTWFLPICGIPMAIAGIVLGALGMKDPSQKTLAVAGIALSAIGLLLGCGNAAYGAYLGFTGQGFNFNF